MPSAKGKKKTMPQAKKGGKARSVFTEKKKRKVSAQNQKEGKGQAERQKGREGKNKGREKKEVQCVSTEPAE